MLDADASFRPDPEAHAPLRFDPVTASPAAAPLPEDRLPTETLPDAAPQTDPSIGQPDTTASRDETADPPAEASTEDTAENTAHDIADDIAEDTAADPRPVTPRRLLRFSSARAAEDAPVLARPVLNLFDGVFDEDDTPTDPRLLRSRARARRLLAAHEAGLSDAERNLWHDDPQPQPAPETASPEPEPQGRRIRHLTAADIAPHPPEPVHDPLRDRLHAARDALYLPHPDDPPPQPRPGLAERLTVQVLNATVLVAAWPVGLALAAITLRRGEDLRLTARTVALVGTASALLQVAPIPLI